MATKQVKIKECDICGKQVSDEGKSWIGGHPFHGWFTVNRTNGSSALHWLQRKHEWEICGTDCLMKFSKTVDDTPKRNFTAEECPCGEIEIA